MTKVIVFDMDGLMFDTEPLYYQANQKTADALGIPFDYSFHQNFIGASDEDFFGAMYEHFSKEKVDQFVVDSKKDLKDVLLSEPPKVKEGLRPLLDYLKEQGYKTVIASSTARKLVEKMVENADLTSYFDAMIGGDEVKQSKPHPEIFERAVALVGDNDSDVLVLEDSLNGIRASYAAGFDCVMVPDLIDPSDEAQKMTIDICDNLNDVLFKIKSENLI